MELASTSNLCFVRINKGTYIVYICLYDYDYSMKSLNTTRNGLQMIELWPMIIIYNYIYVCVSKRNLLNAIR